MIPDTHFFYNFKRCKQDNLDRNKIIMPKITRNMTLSKFLFLLRNTCLVCLVVISLFACSEEDDITSLPDDIILPVDPGDYLVECTVLGEVPAFTIKLTAQLAGYPQFNDYMRYSIKLYRIIYRTTYKGQPILASGIISYPSGISDSIPTMIVGNGLIFADEDAPSEFDLPNNFTGFEFIASMGYLTVIPDMIGFGISRDLMFPIHNYEHSANTMIDLIYASEEFIMAKKLPVTRKKFLTGYSQGGYIALATLKMIEEKAVPGIAIEATAVGAGGFNLVNLLNYSLARNSYSAPSHLAMLLSSYNIMYDWGRPLSDFFQEPYASKIPALLDGTFDRQEIDQQLAYSFDSLLNPDFLYGLKNNEESDLIHALGENNVDNWRPESRLLIIHSLQDERIPISDSEETFNKMISNGSESVSFVTIDTKGHFDSGLAFIEIVLQWFNSLN
jgi:pimeloyl-ACP methyl ester carboxylesterase